MLQGNNGFRCCWLPSKYFLFFLFKEAVKTYFQSFFIHTTRPINFRKRYSGFTNLCLHDYEYYIINYCEDFVVPYIGFHANRGENMWMFTKDEKKQENGT